MNITFRLFILFCPILFCSPSLFSFHSFPICIVDDDYCYLFICCCCPEYSSLQIHVRIYFRYTYSIYTMYTYEPCKRMYMYILIAFNLTKWKFIVDFEKWNNWRARGYFVISIFIATQWLTHAQTAIFTYEYVVCELIVFDVWMCVRAAAVFPIYMCCCVSTTQRVLSTHVFMCWFYIRSTYKSCFISSFFIEMCGRVCVFLLVLYTYSTVIW